MVATKAERVSRSHYKILAMFSDELPAVFTARFKPRARFDVFAGGAARHRRIGKRACLLRLGLKRKLSFDMESVRGQAAI